MFFLILGGVFACFFSCVSGTSARKNRPAALPYVWWTDSIKYTLLPTQNIETPMDMSQLVTASYRGQNYLLNTWVKADETEINMIMINELGANMGELSYRDGAVSFSSPVFSAILPEYIVADFQLCFYNVSALRQALEDCGLSLEDTEAARRILQGNTAIIEIDKSGNFVRLINHVRGYAYTLEGDF